MLSVSRLVNVTINLSPLAAAGRSFGVLNIAGDSDVISGLERIRSYSDITGVQNDFGVSAPEALAAALYFGQTPKPATLNISRWLRTASPGLVLGGLVASANLLPSAWTPISAGSLSVSIDGTVQNLTGLNFTGVTNLNGVASVITAALSGGAKATFTGSIFKILSGSQGAGANATGTITFTANPAVNDTLTIGGTVITFVSALTTGNQVLIGGTAAATAANLQLFLQNSTDTNLVKATYSTAANVTTATAVALGVSGNAITLAKSSSGITLSAATLAGGAVPSTVGYVVPAPSGTDISAMLGLTQSTAQALIPGYNAETPAQCAAALADKSPAWYGLMFAASVMPTDAQNLAVAPVIEALSLTRIFGIPSQDPNAMSSLVTSDLGSLLMGLGVKQTFIQYSSSSPYAIASAFGRAFSVDFTANKSTITLMFKQEPGVAGENLSASQASVLDSKRYNYFVQYVNGTMILQNGVMCGPAYFDEIHGLDWFQDAVQTACYNVLYTSTTKVPQTDAGVNQLVNAISSTCEAAVNNGLAGPGTWTADGFGQLSNGQFLKTGYYIYAQPISLQSASDRAARKAPPIQVALKLAGAIQSLNVAINVNR